MFTCDVIKVYCFDSWWIIDLNKQFFVHFGEGDKRKQTKICVKDIALLFNGDEISYLYFLKHYVTIPCVNFTFFPFVWDQWTVRDEHRCSFCVCCACVYSSFSNENTKRTTFKSKLKAWIDCYNCSLAHTDTTATHKNEKNIHTFIKYEVHGRWL